jgi:hypothetical protein
LVSDFFSGAFFSGFAGFVSSVDVFFSDVGSDFAGVDDFFDEPLSVLYQPLPLKCTAGGEISFSVFFDPHSSHFGVSLLPKGRVNSNT